MEICGLKCRRSIGNWFCFFVIKLCKVLILNIYRKLYGWEDGRGVKVKDFRGWKVEGLVENCFSVFEDVKF